MVKQIKDSVADVDAAVLVTEPLGKIHPIELELLQRFRELQLPAILAINKIDTIPKKDVMMEKISAFSEQFPFELGRPCQCPDGRRACLSCWMNSPVTPRRDRYYFPDDAMTDQPERVIVAEIIREKLLAVSQRRNSSRYGRYSGTDDRSGRQAPN